MPTFDQKKASLPATRATFAIPTREHLGPAREVRACQHGVPARGETLPLRSVAERQGGGEGGTALPGRAGYNFGSLAVVPLGRTVHTATSDGSGGAQAMTRQIRQPFSASIRFARPALQNDSMSADDHEPPRNIEAPATQSPIAPPESTSLEPKEGEGVLFPASGLKSVALAPQTDTIASTFGYKGSINQDGPAPDPGEFGTTRPYFAFERPGPSANQTQGRFDVTGIILGQITYQIAAPPRTDITSDSDPDITQTNYPTVVSDLTPSPAAVNSGGVKLYRNQPRRSRFWARDLTIEHEKFHARENVRYGGEGVALAQRWLNGKTARSYDEVGALLNGVTPIVARHVDTKMALPGREQRAYNDGAPSYTARAQAIKRKGEAKGYIRQLPAPQTPGPPPNPPPATRRKPAN